MMFENDHLYENIFTTIARKKISEICISSRYNIYLRNLDFDEIIDLDQFTRNDFKRFVSSIDDLNNITNANLTLNSSLFEKISELCNLNEKYTIKSIIDYNLSLNDKIVDIIKENNKEMFITECIYFFMKDIVVVEVKDWENIDKMLIEYSGVNNSEFLVELDFRFEFIVNYASLFSIINQCRIFICDDKIFPTIPKIINGEFDYSYISIDNFVENEDDELNLNFILSYMDKGSIFNPRRCFLNYIIILEFMLTRQVDDETKQYGISWQFINNI